MDSMGVGEREVPRSLGTLAIGVVAALVLLLAGVACSGGSSKATVTGTLTMRGGPVSNPPQPVGGEVELTPAAGGRPVRVTVDESGQFRARLDSGTYTAVGHSPMYQSGGLPCHGGPVTVSRSGSTTIDVYCEMM
jgi:hypothetical protein